MKIYIIISTLCFMASNLHAAETCVAVSSENPKKVYETYLDHSSINEKVKFDADTAVKIDSIEKKCRESVAEKKDYPIDLSKWKLGAIIMIRRQEGDYYISYFYKTEKLSNFKKDENVMPPPNSSGAWALVCLTDGTIVHPKY